MKYYYIETNSGYDYCDCSLGEYVMSDNIDTIESYAQDMAYEASVDFMPLCVDEDNPDEVADYGEQSGYELEELTQAEADELIMKGIDFLEM